jgi:hypothetical protein
MSALLAAGGLTYGDVVSVQEANVVRAADDFKAGRLDVFFFSIGAPKVTAVATDLGGLRYLPLTRDMTPRMRKVRPEYYLSEIALPLPIAGIDKPSLAATIDVVVAAAHTSRTTSSISSQRRCARTPRRWPRLMRTSGASMTKQPPSVSRGCRIMPGPSGISSKAASGPVKAGRALSASRPPS